MFALALHATDDSSRPQAAKQIPLPEKSPLTRSGLGSCELSGEATGYRSEPLHLAGERLEGIVRVGTIGLRPLSRAREGESFTVNARSMSAPDSAKQAFQLGQQQARKGKWAAACDYFRSAVQAYPRFALAWLELGRTQVQQNNFAEAQISFQQATAEDPSLMEAYIELARLAMEQKQWKSLADATDHIVALAAESSAAYWFLNSVAKFNLGDVAQAETSALRGLRLDTSHRVPQLEYLYGMILARQQNFRAAAEHIKAYLQITPQAPDAGEAQSKLAELEKLVSTSTPH